MNDRWDDDALLDSLRDALEHTEPAPANVDQVIDTAFSIMDVDEEIAELLDDSLVGASGKRRVRQTFEIDQLPRARQIVRAHVTGVGSRVVGR